jgi:cytochrome P450
MPSNPEDHHKLSNIPFSAGPRKCIGDHFSMIEMKIHLALLVKEYKLTHLKDQPIELEPQVNLRNKYPIFMKVNPR